MMNPDMMLKLFTGVLALCWLMQPVICRIQPRHRRQWDQETRRRWFRRD